MKDNKQIIEMLHRMKHAPKMYSITKEGYMCYVLAYLNVLDIDQMVKLKFCRKFQGIPGTCAVDVELLKEDLDDEYAGKMIDEAITIIIANELAKE